MSVYEKIGKSKTNLFQGLGLTGKVNTYRRTTLDRELYKTATHLDRLLNESEDINKEKTLKERIF